ncbi:MAG: glutamate synthase-related protein, partial [Desulfosarcinaceae bacterium]
MPKKYHIETKDTPPRFHPVGKYATVEFRENCAGSCRKCVKKKCVYNIFKENILHMSAMEEPEYLYTCMSCFRCIQECTRGIFSRTINPEYRTLGDDYWRADILHRLWYQAHTGKIPVSGAGYRGPFAGHGFDAMWTDMSEIVRPTRDGIHGREYINTSIELSRRVTRLAFNPDMSLASEVPPVLEIPIPLLFCPSPDLLLNEHVLVPMARAAKTLGTLLFIKPENVTPALAPYADSLIPCLTAENFEQHGDMIRTGRAVELSDAPGIEQVFEAVRAINPGVTILVGFPLDAASAERAAQLALTGVDTLHFYADDQGNERNAARPRFLKEMIREIHLRLVELTARKQINLVFSGGIAMAEHMAKAIICGADAVTADLALLAAMECRLCGRCRNGLSCPVKLDEPLDAQWGSDRIVNLMGAWCSQLLELMGAMGIREARRLRGEVGRSMWFEDLEREHFGPIFGERKV